MNISLDPKPTYAFEKPGQTGLKVKYRPYFCAKCRAMKMDSTNHTIHHYDSCKKWTCRASKRMNYFDADTMKIGLKSFNVFSGHNGSLLVHYAKIEHDNFKVNFTGRNKGAIGEFYEIVAYLDAEGEDEIYEQIYDKFEHVSKLSFTMIKIGY